MRACRYRSSDKIFSSSISNGGFLLQRGMLPVAVSAPMPSSNLSSSIHQERSISRVISSSLNSRSGWQTLHPWISKKTPKKIIGFIGQKDSRSLHSQTSARTALTVNLNATNHKDFASVSASGDRAVELIHQPSRSHSDTFILVGEKSKIS